MSFWMHLAASKEQKTIRRKLPDRTRERSGSRQGNPAHAVVGDGTHSAHAGLLVGCLLEAEEPVEAVLLLGLVLHAVLGDAAGAGRGDDHVVARTPVGRGGAGLCVCGLECLDDALDLVEVSPGLDKRLRMMIKNSARFIRFHDGARVHGNDTDRTGLLMVLKGSLRAYLLSSSGRECTLFRVEEGECYVLSCSRLLSLVTFDLFLDADGTTELLVVDSEVYNRVAVECLAAEAFAYRQAAMRFSDAMWVMEQVLFMRLEARVAAFLLDEVARRRRDSLSLTHDELARHIGSAREAVSRVLKQLDRRGVVLLSRGRVDVLDKRALRALVGV